MLHVVPMGCRSGRELVLVIVGTFNTVYFFQLWLYIITMHQLCFYICKSIQSNFRYPREREGVKQENVFALVRLEIVPTT